MISSVFEIEKNCDIQQISLEIFILLFDLNAQIAITCIGHKIFDKTDECTFRLQ